MFDFSSETPLIQQWFPALNDALVRTISRTSHLLAIFVVVAGWEHARIYSKLKDALVFIARFRRFVFIELNTSEIAYSGEIPTFERIEYQPDGRELIYNARTGDLVGEKRITWTWKIPDTAYFAIAILAILLSIFVTNHTILFWLIYPFMQVLNAISIWGEISINPWYTILLVPLKSVGYVFWFFVSYGIIYLFFLAAILRTSANLAAYLSNRLTNTAFKYACGIMALLIAIIAFVTS